MTTKLTSCRSCSRHISPHYLWCPWCRRRRYERLDEIISNSRFAKAATVVALLLILVIALRGR